MYDFMYCVIAILIKFVYILFFRIVKIEFQCMELENVKLDIRIILYYDRQMHNYFTNYHTATCFDTIVSSSGSL